MRRVNPTSTRFVLWNVTIICSFSYNEKISRSVAIGWMPLLGSHSDRCRRFHETHNYPRNVILEDLIRNDRIPTSQPDRLNAWLNNVDGNRPIRPLNDQIYRQLKLIIKMFRNRR